MLKQNKVNLYEESSNFNINLDSIILVRNHVIALKMSGILKVYLVISFCSAITTGFQYATYPVNNGPGSLNQPQFGGSAYNRPTVPSGQYVSKTRILNTMLAVKIKI